METTSGKATMGDGAASESPEAANHTLPDTSAAATYQPVEEPGSDVPAPLAELVVAVEELRKERKKKKKKEKDNEKEKEASLGTSRGIETMFRTSYRVNMDLSALADTKSNIMISINGIIISLLLASISPKIDSNFFLLYPTIVLVVGCLFSMIYAILAARPRVSSKLISLDDVRANRANILFFGNFALLDEEEFVTGMTELMRDTDGLYYNMVRDIYGLGRVLRVKYRLLRFSYTIFIIGLTAGVALYIYAFVRVAGTNTVPEADTGFLGAMLSSMLL